MSLLAARNSQTAKDDHRSSLASEYLPLCATVGVQKKEKESLNQFRKMADSMRNGDPRRAIEIYNTLPKEFQDRKVVMLSLISAANLTGDDTVYQNAIERYADNFPDIHRQDL